MTTTAGDHRYLQVARTLRKEIVDGVYPVGSQLPTEHELCERFAVSRYTVREALRRLRDDNLVTSKPRAGTLVVPRPSNNSYAQDVVSIEDLLAFAQGARFAIDSNAMVTVDAALAERTGLAPGTEWLGVAGYRRIDERTPPALQRPRDGDHGAEQHGDQGGRDARHQRVHDHRHQPEPGGQRQPGPHAGTHGWSLAPGGRGADGELGGHGTKPGR